MCMVTVSNEMVHDDHFVIYRNIESLCCVSETNVILYVNYISVKRKEKVIIILLSRVNDY